MTHQPFNQDTFIGPEIKKLVEKWSIKTIVETGTWSAHTTRELVTMGPHVITIDSTWDHLYEEFGPHAVVDLMKLGIEPIIGDSSKILGDLISDAIHPILFYLDAHGGGANNSNVNPLLEEFDAIADSVKCRDNCAIVVHDFMVPGKGWGYNWGAWDGREPEPLSYMLIKSRLDKIYPSGHSYHYNEEADGLQRGVIYVHCPYIRGE